jgi:hypothetical protein
MPISAQREVARTVLVPGLLGALHVNRRPPGSAHLHVPAPDRVTWIRDNPNPDTTDADGDGGDPVVGPATFTARNLLRQGRR